MFSSLKNVLKKDWYSNDENLIINLYTPNALTQYKVFSVYEIRAENYYATPFFSSDATYSDFLNKIKSRSIHNFNVNLCSSDEILTLSTCSNNNAFRVVLHAKKIINGS